MRGGVRRTLSLLAITAIALHAVLWGAAAPPAASATIDPFSIICHSETPGAAPDAQTPGDSAPTHACDHCNLCSVTAPPAALDTVLAGRLEPARLLQILRPLASAARSSRATTPKLARGPPSFA
jgi:hypothetical protein